MLDDLQQVGPAVALGTPDLCEAVPEGRGQLGTNTPGLAARYMLGYNSAKAELMASERIKCKQEVSDNRAD